MTEILSFIFAASSVGVLTLGFFLGLKHATEADHLAAVSAIVTERKSLFSSAAIGGLWGLGHTLSLLVVGVLVLLLDFRLSERLENALEFCVGVMLVLLGANVFRKIIQGGELHFHEHKHGNHKHAHPHIHNSEVKDAEQTHHGFSLSPRALIIGMVHGLAGSAALMLLILETIESKTIGALYILIFGVGSIGGMILMSFLVGLPFHFTALRLTRFNLLLRGGAGLFSIFWGAKMILEKGFSIELLS